MPCGGSLPCVTISRLASHWRRSSEVNDLERRWLDYAWDILNCPEEHRRRCVGAGAAVPGPRRVDGNDLPWPGYLGQDWNPNRGVLCVGAVHREPSPEGEAANPVGARTNAELIECARRWLREGR